MLGYRELRETAAWLDVSLRGRIALTGDDRARLLHAMCTNHIQQLQPGEGCYAFFLTVQGRVLADARIDCRPDSFLVDTEEDTRARLYEHLDRYIIADDVTLDDITEQTAELAVEGPASSEVLTNAGLPVPEKPFGNIEWREGLVAQGGFAGGPGFRIVLPNGAKANLISSLQAAGASEADAEAVRVVRLEHGRPRYGEDIGEGRLVSETNQFHAIHFNKGCYLGQEIVERVRARGRVHRLLTAFEFPGSEAPLKGSKIELPDGSAAEITSAAYSPARDAIVALGYVRHAS